MCPTEMNYRTEKYAFIKKLSHRKYNKNKTPGDDYCCAFSLVSLYKSAITEYFLLLLQYYYKDKFHERLLLNPKPSINASTRVSTTICVQKCIILGFRIERR